MPLRAEAPQSWPSDTPNSFRQFNSRAPWEAGNPAPVECYDVDGNAADSRFTVQFIR